jgi:predicted dehydrogenase
MAAESYFEKKLSFKIRKAIRYVELYGLKTTITKIKGQNHMRARVGFDGPVWRSAASSQDKSARRNVGIIGCGSFSYSTIAYHLNRKNPSTLKGAMDLDPCRARSLAQSYGAEFATTDASLILTDPDIKLVYIASNHATHGEYAIEAIRNGKHVHIEKPHVVSGKQLEALLAAMKDHPESKVFLGFNRPRSALFIRLQLLLAAQVGPLMINWFVAGHAIDDDHWYFKPEEGGRILGNLCHWTDLSLMMVACEHRLPCKITPAAPTGSKSDFVTALEFADGTMASITFSAKGHTFEGVREILNVHRGDLLAELKDFKSLTIALAHERKTWISRVRDHGHRSNILNSYDQAFSHEPQTQDDLNHIDLTARLFLAVREAHEKGQPIVLTHR